MFAIENPDNSCLDIFDFLEYPYNNIFKRDLYNETFDIYAEIQKLILKDITPAMFPVCFLSCDTSVSSATILGFVEKFSTIGSCGTFTTNLNVVYINKNFNMNIIEDECTYTDVPYIVLSNALGMTDCSFTKHKINLSPQSLHCVGTVEPLGSKKSIKFNNYSLETIKKDGIIKITSDLISKIKNSNVYIVLDIDAIDFTFAPSSTRLTKNGLNLDEMYVIIDAIKKNSTLCGIDINGFYFGEKSKRIEYGMSNQLTCATIHNLVSRVTNAAYNGNELKLSNILDHEFIIWKKTGLDNWSVFNALSDDTFDELLFALNEKNKLEIPIAEDGETYIATLCATTIGEQLKLSFYEKEAESLPPDEKKIAIRYFLIKHGKST